MKLVVFEEYLINFLSDDKKNVLMVKGKWGVGKTYYISKALEKSEDYSPIRVSLFGVNKIEDITRSISDEIINNMSKRGVSKVAKSICSIPMISKFLPSNCFDLTELDNKLAKSVIFFDDLERSGLKLNEVFGYIDKIKNNSSFKILIAINDDEVKKVEWDFKEKVIDCELRLKSTLEHLIVGIYEEDSDLANRVFDALKVENIRTVKKSKLTMDYFVSRMNGLDDSNLVRLKLSCLVHSALYYTHGINDKSHLDKFSNQISRLHLYDHNFSLNSVINSYLDSEHIDNSVLESIKNRLIQKQNRERTENGFKKLCELVDGTFDDNVQNIIQSSHSVINDSNASFYELSYCVRLLSHLDADINYSSLDRYFESEENLSQWELSRLIDDISNEDLSKYLSSKLSPKTKEQTSESSKTNNSNTREGEIACFLIQMSNSSVEPWLEHVSQFDINDWIALFKLDSSMQLIRSRSRELVQIIDSEEGKNLRSAIGSLEKVAINKFRLKYSFEDDLVQSVENANK